MKKTAPDGAVSGMPAIRETGPGKNLQAITVSTSNRTSLPPEVLILFRPQKAKNQPVGWFF
ncbi:hypothetical protein F6I15_16970 [Escherichia coli]|nr:hypothetical protein F6I15_16970 [Escherichia coli]RRM26251.1 hypothetical protein DU304_20005 [Escherichia coli]